MEVQKFIKVLKAYKNYIDTLYALEDFGIDLNEGPITVSVDTIFDEWLDSVTNEAGTDLVYWWLFEDVDKIIYKDNEVVATLDTEEALYFYLKENGYFK